MPIEYSEKFFSDDVVLLKPKVFKDHRGFFYEVFKKSELEKYGVPSDFVQENHSGSIKNVVRGLHFQWEPPMGKLMRVTRGKAFLVAVDIRKNSPTLGKWVGVEASEDNRYMLWAPPYFARGFAVLSNYAEIQYLVTGEYNNKAETGILWNDPEIGIEWPVKNPILSEKDKNAQTLKEWLNRPEANNFVWNK